MSTVERRYCVSLSCARLPKSDGLGGLVLTTLSGYSHPIGCGREYPLLVHPFHSKSELEFPAQVKHDGGEKQGLNMYDESCGPFGK